MKRCHLCPEPIEGRGVRFCAAHRKLCTTCRKLPQGGPTQKYCKGCQAKRHAAWYRKNREEQRAKARERYHTYYSTRAQRASARKRSDRECAARS